MTDREKMCWVIGQSRGEVRRIYDAFNIIMGDLSDEECNRLLDVITECAKEIKAITYSNLGWTDPTGIRKS